MGRERIEGAGRVDAARDAMASLLAGVRHTPLLPVLPLLRNRRADSESAYLRRARFNKKQAVLTKF